MDAATMERAVADLALLPKQTITLTMHGGIALSLFSTLQVCLRHPDFAGRLANDEAERIALVLQDKLSLTPALTEMLEDGWHPEADYEPGKPDPLDYVPGRKKGKG